MWIVKSVPDEQIVLEILTGKEYTIGRKSGDILLANDASVSRKHANLISEHAEANLSYPFRIPTLKLTDLSKYGTFVNSEKVASETYLKANDVVRFGTLSSLFKVTYQPFVACTSCLDASTKTNVKQFLLKLGGHLVAEWRKECTHLIMQEITVTIKVVCALSTLNPIVTPQYLIDLRESVQSKCAKPREGDYVPPVTEKSIKSGEFSFSVNPRRSKLFEGKTFVFLSPKHFKKLSVAISLAGGKPILLEEGTDDNDDSILTALGSCVMCHNATDESQKIMSENARHWISHVTELVAKSGKRLIQDSEIGMAILHCSTERYCNPDDTGAMLRNTTRHMPSQSLSQFVQDTQLSQVNVQKNKRVAAGDVSVIKETCPVPGTPSSLSTSKLETSLNNNSFAETSFQQSHDVNDVNHNSTAVEEPRIKTEKITPPEAAEDNDVQVINGHADAVPINQVKTEHQDTSAKEEFKKPLHFWTRATSQKPDGDMHLFPVEKTSPICSGSDLAASKPKSDIYARPERADSNGLESEVVDDNGQTHKNVVVENGDIGDVSEEVDDIEAVPSTSKDFLQLKTNNSVASDVLSSLPAGLVQLKVVPLLRKPQSTARKRTHVALDTVSSLKNFKKFRKVKTNSDNSLPHIIGGSDLTTHVSTNLTGYQDMMFDNRDVMMQNSEQQMMDELWNAGPSRKKSKK